MSTDPGNGRAETGVEPLVFGGRTLRIGDRIGSYVFERELGSGGMARVLLARDPGGQPVALKVLRASRFDTGLARFRREFDALSRLRHPNIIRVDAYGDLFGHPFIAMEYVDGPDLHTVIRNLRHDDDAARYPKVQDILVQLCRALAAIHRRGMVHRDLKPSNVLVTRDGVCKLTDFGIVKEVDPRHNPHLSATLVGTWAYTSPEHITGLPVDHRSDLYSLGVILFALLTGKRPFVAENMAGYLAAHRDKAAPRASSVRATVPDHLDEICARLLEKAPRDRFQSAQEILHRLNVGDDASERAESGLWTPPFVGHDEAFAVLDDAVGGLTAGRGGVVQIEGEDGTGRSRLLDRVVDRARMLGLGVHAHTFQAGAPVFSTAMRLARELLRELPDASATALRGLVAAWGEGGSLRGDVRYALYDALREALAEALADRPQVVALDDVHEAAPQEVDLIGFLARSLPAEGEGERAPLLFVLTARRGHMPDVPGVEAHRVALHGLAIEDMRKLVASLLGPGRAADTLAERLQRETDGNAWIAVEFLRSMISSHLIVRDEDRWLLRVDASELAAGHLEIPPGIRQMLGRRLDGLDDAQRDVLAALAVAQRDLDVDTLLAVLDADDEATLSCLEALIAAGLVSEQRVSGELRYAVVHRAVAELIVRELSAERRRGLHAAVARALEGLAEQEPELLETIGHHWREAGDAGLALQQLVTAASRLVERSMPEAAWAVIERAQGIEAAAAAALPSQDFDLLRREVLAVRVAAQMNRGAWADAARDCEALVHIASAGRTAVDERAACKARLELARICRMSGDRARSRAEAEGALRSARRIHYRLGVASALHNLAALAWSEGDLDRCDELTSEGLVVANGPQLGAERARLLLTHALSLGMRGQLASSIRHLQEAEGLFSELSMQPLRVLAAANIAELQTWQGDLHDALARCRDALRRAEGLGYRLGIVASRRVLGLASLESGRLHDAQGALLEALREARSVHLHDEALAASVALVRLALARGDVGSALRHGREALGAAQHGDPERYLPWLQALLAQALAHTQPRVAWGLLAAALDAMPSLPVPRRVAVEPAAAAAWLALGDKSRAIDMAESLVRDRAARPFRLVQIEVRDLLARATTGEVSARHAAQAARLRETLHAPDASTGEEPPQVSADR